MPFSLLQTNSSEGHMLISMSSLKVKDAYPYIYCLTTAFRREHTNLAQPTENILTLQSEFTLTI